MGARPASRQEDSLAATTAHADERLGNVPVSRPEATRPLRAEFIAITGDDLLLEHIGRALDGESTVRHVETAAAAREFLRPSQPCVLLLDARGLDDPAATVEGLQSPDITSVVVVFAPADRSADIARAIRGSAAFAVLPIPVEQAQAVAVIEGAHEESLARHTLASAPPPRPVVAAPPQPVVSNRPEQPAVAVVRSAPGPDESKAFATLVGGGRSGGGVSKLVIAAVAGIALLAAAVAWFTLRKPELAETAQQVAVAPGPAAIPDGSVDELLERARTAIRERRYTDPEGDNALNHYRSVLAQEPDNGEAREGMLRVSAVLHERAQAALDARRPEEAARTIAQLRSIRPDDPALAELEGRVADARIATAFAEGNVERANNLLRQAVQAGVLPEQNVARWRGELERRQTGARAEQLARLVSIRIREGKLLAPAADSAKHHLAQLRRLPHDPEQLAGRATTELQQAYLKKFREASAQGQRAEADRWHAEARAIGVGATELAALQRDATSRASVKQTQQESTTLAQRVQERIDDGRLIEPAGDSALFHLNALKATNPPSSAVAPIERALSEKLLARARSALAEREVQRAQANVAAARQLGQNLDAVAALERDIAAAYAATAKTTAPAIVLKRTRYAPPEYPKEALQKGLAGEVRVRITVQADGRVKDVVVEKSTPEQVFDAAALAAARKWRFKPIGQDDSGVETSAVTTIVFKPQDANPR